MSVSSICVAGFLGTWWAYLAASFGGLQLTYSISKLTRNVNEIKSKREWLASKTNGNSFTAHLSNDVISISDALSLPE